MVKHFWKKITLVNIGLLLILLRIYGFFLSFIESIENNNSIFPSEDENGYPFKEKLNCDFNSLKTTISKNISEKKVISILSNQKCFIYNNFWFDYISMGRNSYYEHFLNSSLYDITMEFFFQSENKKSIIADSIWENIYKLNNFNEKEMDFMYRIISGMQSTININKDNLIKVTSSYEAMNNLIYFYSLIIRSISDDEFSNECLVNFNDIPLLTIDDKEIAVNIIQKIKRIFINDNNSPLKTEELFLVSSIEIIIKSLFIKKISEEEANILFLLREYVASKLNYIYVVDKDLSKLAKKYSKYSNIFRYLYLALGILVVFIMNRIILKNTSKIDKGFLGRKSKVDKMKMRFLKKSLIEQKRYEAIKRSEQINDKGVPLSEFTEEEREYIEKLTNGNKSHQSNLKNEFVVTH